MNIHITEGKSDHPLHNRSSVRVFFDRDYDYGYFIPENLVFDVLTDFQKVNYTKHDKFGISEKTAKLLMENGITYPPVEKEIDVEAICRVINMPVGSTYSGKDSELAKDFIRKLYDTFPLEFQSVAADIKRDELYDLPN